MLLATAVAIDEPPGVTVDPLNIAAVGRSGPVEAAHDSWLLLRVGDDPADLAGNRGTVQIRIFLAPSGPQE
jgi:hypothetical protein